VKEIHLQRPLNSKSIRLQHYTPIDHDFVNRPREITKSTLIFPQLRSGPSSSLNEFFYIHTAHQWTMLGMPIAQTCIGARRVSRKSETRAVR